MATYIILGSFTDQGLHNIADTAERATELQAVAERSGLQVRDVYWTLGPYDFVVVVESPSEEDLAVGLYGLAALGNTRTQTLCAFDREAITRIAEKMQP